MINEITKRLDFIFGKKLPMILQSEVTECGLACVAMVASYHGNQVDLATLRRHFSISLKGSTLKELAELAQKLRFIHRGLKLDLDELKCLRTPCILHWDLNHFVVLKKVQGNSVIIHDPAIGIVKHKFSEVSNHFTGVALELTPAIDFEKNKSQTRLYLSNLWSSISGIRAFLVQILLLSLSLEVFEIIRPLFIQLVIDDVIVAKDFSLLNLIASGFGMLVIIQVATSYIRFWVIIFLSNTLNIQLVANLMHHLLKLPLDFFEKRHIGDIVSRFGSINSIQAKLSTDFIVGIVDGVMIVTTLIMLLIYSFTLTAIVLSALLLYIATRLILYPTMKYKTSESVITSAKEQSIFMESVRAILPLKVFGKESQRENVWQNSYADKLNASISLSKTELIYKSVMQFIFGLEYILIIFIGTKAIINNQGFSIGMLMAYLTYRQQFVNRAQNLIEMLMQYQMIKIHLERISDIALTEPEKSITITSSRIIEGSVRVENLAFRYSEQDPYMFKNLSFEVKPGEILALIGRSGCGKTTLIKILLSLLPPSSGNIYIDGVDIRKIGLHTYRSQVAAVMQEDTLLSGSIAENICFFDQKPDFNRIYTCASVAAIHNDIRQMPMAYETLIGDMGAALSGGQKQRILLARALYFQPKILFLDEATSNLDIENENTVNQHIKQIGITRIIISHRKETVKIADQIINLEDFK